MLFFLSFFKFPTHRESIHNSILQIARQSNTREYSRTYCYDLMTFSHARSKWWKRIFSSLGSLRWFPHCLDCSVTALRRKNSGKNAIFPNLFSPAHVMEIFISLGTLLNPSLLDGKDFIGTLVRDRRYIFSPSASSYYKESLRDTIPGSGNFQFNNLPMVFTRNIGSVIDPPNPQTSDFIRISIEE